LEATGRFPRLVENIVMQDYPIGSFKKGAPVFDDTKEFVVVTRDGDVRTARFSRSFDYGNMIFSDCSHPAQNAFCGRENIVLHREA